MIRLREAELFRVRLPLVTPLRSALATTSVKEALLLRVRTDDAIGWGECVADVHAGYLTETIDDVRCALRDHLLPSAFAGTDLDVGDDHRVARAVLADALLDATLRATGVSLAAHLGAVRDRVGAGVVIGRVDDENALRSLARRYVEQGYRRIKCKIEPGHDLAPLRIVRAEAGDAVALAGDANGSYDFDSATRLFDDVEPVGLQCVEQPLASDDLAGHRALTLAAKTPVCLDESIDSVSNAQRAVQQHACRVVSVKPGRLGGVERAAEVVALCADAGVDVLVGGMLETGVGRATLLAVAALPGVTLVGDCSASERYFGADGDITTPFVLDGGTLAVPNGPGIGVEPLPECLAAVTIAHERITPA